MLGTHPALFVVASLALIATPGQDNVYILTRGIAQGRRAALVSAWGVSAGLLVHTALAVAGLSVILARSAFAFSVVKYVGAAYLLYLGLRMVLSRDTLAISGADGSSGTGMGRVFAQGIATNVLNPKVALFFLAFLPQFASASGSGSTFLSLGLLFVALALVATTVLALFCGAVGDWLKGRPGIAKAVVKIAGGVLVVLAVRLAFTNAR